MLHLPTVKMSEQIQASARTWLKLKLEFASKTKYTGILNICHFPKVVVDVAGLRPYTRGFTAVEHIEDVTKHLKRQLSFKPEFFLDSKIESR